MGHYPDHKAAHMSTYGCLPPDIVSVDARLEALRGSAKQNCAVLLRVESCGPHRRFRLDCVNQLSPGQNRSLKTCSVQYGEKKIGALQIRPGQSRVLETAFLSFEWERST
jgi:hypothetical protein